LNTRIRTKSLHPVTFIWKVTSVLFMLVMLVVLFRQRGLFFGSAQETTDTGVTVPFASHRIGVFIFLILLTIFTGAVSLFRKMGKTKRYAFQDPLHALFFLVLIFLNAVLSFYEIELINNAYLYVMDWRYIYLGWGITFILYLVLVGITGSLSIGMVSGNLLFFLWGTANYFVQKFRGIPFQWIDFGSIRTAASVAGNYVLTPSWQIITCLTITAALCMLYLNAGFFHNVRRIWVKVLTRLLAAALALSFWTVLIRTDFLSDQGIWLRDWQPWYTYRLFGMEAGFFAFAKASFPVAPDSYSDSRVEEIISDSEKETSGKNDNEDLETPENIICIMNESFADLSIYPNLKTDVEIMPNVDALKENTQQGKLMVSVKGGTTANTEYEFLTGNSCVLSPSTVVYNSFIKQDQFSLASTLKSQGYTVYALHPYGRNGWNRELVYPKMQFDEFFSIENCFENASTVRGFVSDQADYDQLISMTENKKPGEKLFLFNVTMQNHSPYQNLSLESTVNFENYSGSDLYQAEQYETLIRLSDQAIGNLINYYKNSDQKTMIVFWGDHQPEIGDDFWQYCYGKSLSDLSFEEQQMMYETRYFIWTNYDIPEAENQTLSANYLSSYLLSLTGLESTGYNRYLMNLRSQIPAMNAYGYLGTDGKQHEWGSADAGEEETSALDAYECLIYNELTAGKDRDDTFFGITDNG
jgi:hypothetical protein